MTQEHVTPDAPQVTVRGEGRLEIDPELARIWVTVSARGTDRSRRSPTSPGATHRSSN